MPKNLQPDDLHAVVVRAHRRFQSNLRNRIGARLAGTATARHVPWHLHVRETQSSAADRSMASGDLRTVATGALTSFDESGLARRPSNLTVCATENRVSAMQAPA